MSKRPTQMQRVEAARAILRVESGPTPWRKGDEKEAEVAAFMAIFHPEHVLPRGERYTTERKP